MRPFVKKDLFFLGVKAALAVIKSIFERTLKKLRIARFDAVGNKFEEKATDIAYLYCGPVCTAICTDEVGKVGTNAAAMILGRFLK